MVYIVSNFVSIMFGSFFQIKIVAEDYKTLKQAKRMVFKKLEAASPRVCLLPFTQLTEPHSLNLITKGRRGKECVKYKLLGDCDNEQCRYVHREACYR